MGGGLYLQRLISVKSARRFFSKLRYAFVPVTALILADLKVYDECVQNNTFYFAVTNLKQWVFGTFVSAISCGMTRPPPRADDVEYQLLDMYHFYRY
jgi:hypothetical protein